MADPTLRLTLDEQRDLARERLDQMIADDPSGFIDWLGNDQHDLLVEIMRTLDHCTAGRGIFSDHRLRHTHAIHQISNIIDSYVNRYIESLLP